MKPITVVKRSRAAHSRPWLHLKTIEKPKQAYERHLVRALSQAQQPMSQDLWAVEVLNTQNVTSDGFQAIATEAARLSQCRRRNAITRTEICSALKGLYPAGCPGAKVPSSG